MRTLKDATSALAERICHDEQVAVWASELLDFFSDEMKPEDFEQVLALHGSARAAVRDLVEKVLSHDDVGLGEEPMTVREIDHRIGVLEKQREQLEQMFRRYQKTLLKKET